jgi:hypothetical protein
MNVLEVLSINCWAKLEKMSKVQDKATPCIKAKLRDDLMIHCENSRSWNWASDRTTAMRLEMID